MSLLSVTVKKARYVGMQATQLNTYVTLKLQNVKSTTVTVKGPTPCWEQDFLFETNDINSGLLVEVWNKGVIWDRALGYHWLPLTTVAYANDVSLPAFISVDCSGRWVELEAHLVMRGGAVVGTTGVTGHTLLLDCRFELPFDAEGAGAEAAADLQRKLDLLNGALDAERAEQARRQMQYIAHSGYSEDSDYTSDLNYPVGQHANCSASQFRTAAHQMHTPQRSLEVSRENSYERDEYTLHSDADPLYYNSRPRTNRNEWSEYPLELQAQTSVESAISWRTAADWQSGEEQRRPSLERQSTLFDDLAFGYDSFSATNIGDLSKFSQQPSYEEYFDSSSFPFHGTPYISSEEHRQWDSGGTVLRQELYEDEYYEQLAAMQEAKTNRRRFSVVQLPQLPNKNASSRYSDYNGMEPYRPRQRRTAASLPATPSSTPRSGRALPLPPTAGSGSGRSRRLPRLPYPQPAPTSLLSNRHVPYNLAVTDKSFSARKYSYDDSYDYQQPEYQDTMNNSSYHDEDGMQPFFNETPHATPPAAQKMPWSDADTTSQFKYPAASYEPPPPGTLPPVTTAAPPLPVPASRVPASAPLAHPAPAAGKESTMLAGAQTFGLLMAGGAKKLSSGVFGSLFSAPATAPRPSIAAAPTTISYATRFTAAKTELPTPARAAPILPRAPSLRRQESLQRPSVRRLRSLPDAPDDAAEPYDDYYPAPAADAYANEYDDRPADAKDDSALNRFREEEVSERLANGSRRASSEAGHVGGRKSSQEKFARGSPARAGSGTVNGFGSRKPSVDSYGSMAGRRTPAEEYPEEEKPHVPTTETEPTVDKNGRESVEDRTSFEHEEQYHEESRKFSEQHDSYPEQKERFHEETDKLDHEDDNFRVEDDAYHEGNEEFQDDDETFDDEQEKFQEEEDVFHKEQPKLTPRQLWHRAYNKIIMQLNMCRDLCAISRPRSVPHNFSLQLGNRETHPRGTASGHGLALTSLKFRS